jgi:hypothetical protein
MSYREVVSSLPGAICRVIDFRREKQGFQRQKVVATRVNDEDVSVHQMRSL